jgi:hypothetical protein
MESGWGAMGVFCKYGNGSSDSIKDGEFLDQLSDCRTFEDPTRYLKLRSLGRR